MARWRVMTALLALAESWLAEAERLDSLGCTEAAQTSRQLAHELQEALRRAEDEALTLSEAASVSGYSERRLRELIADGTIPNAGEKGRPRIRRGDLPRKRSKATGGFDAAAEVRAVLGDGR